MAETQYKKTRYTAEAEEIIRLYYGAISMNQLRSRVQKAMGRTVTMKGLRLKILRMGLESYRVASNAITLRDVSEAFNLSHSCTFYWVNHLGLPIKKVNGINGYTVEPKAFWNWAKNQRIDFSRYAKGSILPEPPLDKKTGKSWLDDAIKASYERNNRQAWSETDTRTLIRLKNQDLSYKEIQKHLPHKTEAQIIRRVQTLKRKGVPIHVKLRIPISEEEKAIIYSMRQQGYSLQAIADEFSRDSSTIIKCLKIIEREKQKGSC